MYKQAILDYELFKSAQELHQSAPGALDKKTAEHLKQLVQRKLKLEQMVLSSPEALKVGLPNSHIEDAYNKLRMRYESEQEFVTDINAMGLQVQDYKAALARELKLEAVMDLICADCNEISDTDVELFYYMHSARFIKPELRKARHILITVNESLADNSHALAQKKISEIYRRLIKNTSRFAEQALKHSECPTALDGGYLGEVKRGLLYAELERELFALSAGQLSDIIESPLGFHILYCDEVIREQQLALDQVAEKLRETLKSRQRKSLQRQWLTALIKKSGVQELALEKQVELLGYA
ncbi:nitrogen fixation protein NifM [Agaribacterium haliotis]|uniref:nitrogen fixation protein NifM n=1 Tax=Agaribacterium haliotis TaxID=2013869 RepID=UPI000BB58FDC|nr:nitrogen fixation protein NifM [Agaribacterium haliotis]